MFYYLKYINNLDNWKNKEDIDRRCGICYGNHELTFSHISNAIHRNNIQKLGDLEWWKIPEDKLYDYLHSKKTTNSYRGKK
jgi:hypothetical protein